MANTHESSTPGDSDARPVDKEVGLITVKVLLDDGNTAKAIQIARELEGEYRAEAAAYVYVKASSGENFDSLKESIELISDPSMHTHTVVRVLTLLLQGNAPIQKIRECARLIVNQDMHTKVGDLLAGGKEGVQKTTQQLAVELGSMIDRRS